MEQSPSSFDLPLIQPKLKKLQKNYKQIIEEHVNLDPPSGFDLHPNTENNLKIRYTFDGKPITRSIVGGALLRKEDD